MTCYLLNKMAQHGLRNIEISDHAIPHGTDCHNIAGGAPNHLPGFLTNCQDIVGISVNSNHRWLLQHDPLTLYINQYIRCT